MTTIAQVLADLPRPGSTQLVAPAYAYASVEDALLDPDNSQRIKVALAVTSMKDHTTDEGWQIMLGLQSAGYDLQGYGVGLNLTDVRTLLEQVNPSVMVVNDKREWDLVGGDFRDPRARFRRVKDLLKRDDIFKLTILKDAQQRPDYHRQSAAEMGVHAWIVYYHPRIVHWLAPYTRLDHLIRTYHSLDTELVPEYTAEGRDGALLSGALGTAYPLRQMMAAYRGNLPKVTWLQHPGYHRKGCCTPDFLKTLARFKVALCTSSRYGYALRKIIEATACGCIVVTDLPSDETLPEIDGNLVRIEPTIHPKQLGRILAKLYQRYNPDKQAMYAAKARAWYDYHTIGKRLADDIDRLRSSYNQPACQPTLDPTLTPISEPTPTITVPQEMSRMTEEEALRRMVAPGTPREGKYRKGVIQVHVTRACDKACYGCTQGSNLGGRQPFISLANFELAVKSLTSYFGVVGVFGGNPATHPQFDKLCTILYQHIPYERRGLWCNNPLGKAKLMRGVFNPAISNLNVHLDKVAYDEFKRDWPESQPFGLKDDSRHSPPYVALQDVVADEEERWALISRCPINLHWSAMLGEFRGQLRAWFCEIAGAQSILHQDEPDYPDTGKVVMGEDWVSCGGQEWWEFPMKYYDSQVRHHCHACGVPLQGYGELAQSRSETATEQVSKTHEGIYYPKRRDRIVQVVTERIQLGKPLVSMVDYLGNAKR